MVREDVFVLFLRKCMNKSKKVVHLYIIRFFLFEHVIMKEDKLIANHHTPEEIAALTGADSIGFLPIESLGEMSGCETYCSACFDGDYPTKIPSDPRKDRFEKKLSEAR